MGYNKRHNQINKSNLDFIKYCFSELINIAQDDIYLVGGYVRDRLLKKASEDYDIVFLKNPLNISKILSKNTKGVFVLLDKERETSRIVWNKKDFTFSFDITKIIGENIEQDLLLRDLTINSIAIPLKADNLDNILDLNYIFKNEELIDPSNGYIDLKNKLVRTYNKNNLKNDPLRILRVFRFSSKLNFKIDLQTLHYSKELSELIVKPAKERVLKEFLSVFKYNNSYLQLEQMYKINLLSYLFIDFKVSDKHFDNVIIKMKLLEELILSILEKKVESEFLSNLNEYSNKIENYLFEETGNDSNKLVLIKIAIIFIYLSKEINDIENYISKVESLLKIFKFSNNEQKSILLLIKTYLNTEKLLNIKLNRLNLYNYFKEREKEVLGSLLISISESNFIRENNINLIIESYFEDILLTNPPKLLDGRDISKELKVKPGKIIGIILENIKSLQAQKIISTYEEAIEVSRKIICSENN